MPDNNIKSEVRKNYLHMASDIQWRAYSQGIRDTRNRERFEQTKLGQIKTADDKLFDEGQRLAEKGYRIKGLHHPYTTPRAELEAARRRDIRASIANFKKDRQRAAAQSVIAMQKKKQEMQLRQATADKEEAETRLRNMRSEHETKQLEENRLPTAQESLDEWRVGLEVQDAENRINQ